MRTTIPGAFSALFSEYVSESAFPPAEPPVHPFTGLISLYISHFLHFPDIYFSQFPAIIPA